MTKPMSAKSSGANAPGPYDWRAALEKMEGAYAERTIGGYRSDFALFESWCIERNLTPVPASAGLVAQYLEQNIAQLSASTLERRLASIIRVHRLLDFADPVDNETVRLALRRIKRFRPIRPRQARGINRQLRTRMLAVCGNDLAGLRDKALIAVGFEGLCRRSEIASLDVRDVTQTDEGDTAIVIRRGKADPFGEGRVIILSESTGDILDQWITKAGLQTGPLFRPVYHSTPVRRHLSGYTISCILKKVARQAGFDENVVGEISGHSLRVGGAQTLLKDGHDMLRLMKIGGWRSMNTVSRYVERADLKVWQ